MQDVKNIEKFDAAISYLSDKIFKLLINLEENIKINSQEIRLRVNCPIIIYCKKKSYFINNKSSASLKPTSDSFILDKKHIDESFKKICDDSIYSHQEEISLGFITLKGGHRVGISGSVAVFENKLLSFQNISSLNLRISREFPGCANNLLDFVKNTGTLIVGEPGSGKTTLLRDLARGLSIKKKVVIIDERQEIAGGFKNSWQNNIGFCDVISKIPKELGLLYALRSLSPEILICDEVGEEREIEGIKKVVNSGVLLIASIHAKNLKELILKNTAKKLLETSAFKNIVIMKSKEFPCEIKKIYRISDEDVKTFRNFNDDNLHILDRLSCVS